MENIKNLEKRCYTFSHFMLSPMAKGIQTLHSTVELFNKYVPNPGNDDMVKVNDNLSKDPYSILFDWSLNHKTVISLNPGVSGDLDDLVYLFQDPENFYPWADFHEDEYSLKGVKTAISIVLSEKIYETATLFRTKNFEWNYDLGKVICIDISKTDFETLVKIEKYGTFSEFEINLVMKISELRLAS